MPRYSYNNNMMESNSVGGFGVAAFNTPLHTTTRSPLCNLHQHISPLSPRIIPPPTSASSSAFSPFSPSSSRCPPFRANNHRHRRGLTRQHALPSPHDLGLDGSFLNSIGDFLHTTTSTAAATTTHVDHDHLSSMLLSDSAVADSPPPHLSAREILGEIVEEVEDELRSEMTEDNNGIVITPEMEKASLNDVGHDLIIFLTICVVVAPLSSALGISPVLLYLLFGLITGPHGLQILRGNEEVGFELGDFGILFLLFVEGLNLSPERLRELGSFFSLGATQLLFSVGVIFFGLFLGGPLLFQVVSNPSVPIDPLIVQLLEQPVVAFAIAAAGALSSSAFVLPILKEKGWEDRPDGIAALSILLLQDLAVAPLLVLLPLIAQVEGVGTGEGGADPIALGILAFKATVGFGAVLSLASVALRKVFQVVASSRSSQSFVAASLLVAVGMGVVSDFLGLSSTTGAFAAGVLLAESGYRAQIEADIKPFEGILLGVFFVTAGSALDPNTVIECWPTLIAGILSFLVIKFSVIYSAGGALGISRGDAARVGLLLAGGGEFAFVVFNLAADNGIIPDSLGSLLTASVIISMALTPLLGEVAEYVGNQLDVQEAEEIKDQWFGGEKRDIDYDVSIKDDSRIQEAFDRFDKDGNGEITAEELREIFVLAGEKDGEGQGLSLEQVKSIIRRFDDNDDGILQYEEFAQLWMAKRRSAMSEEALRQAVVVCGYNEVGQQLCSLLDKANIAGIPYVAFARKTEQISASVTDGARVVYGDGTSGSLIRAAGVQEPTAIAITYSEANRCQAATELLREAFPDTPIFVRADSQSKQKELIKGGATEVICATGTVASGIGQLLGVKRRFGEDLSDESSAALGFGSAATALFPAMSKETDDDKLAGLAAEMDTDRDREETRKLYKLFSTSLSLNEDGEAQLSELVNELLRTSELMVTDDQLSDLLQCNKVDDESNLSRCMIDAEEKFVSFSEFITLYRKNIRLGKEEEYNK
mmetsp:Transcript_1681/g.3722  ORF Transcript_1681/g.3722 Transcript_1681/m.3722 type:complete len:992 (-) Transcript_1681:66-3041(-)